MKKLISLTLVLAMLFSVACVLGSCDILAGPGGNDNDGEIEPKVLDAPKVTLVGSTAVWTAVKGATGYEVSSMPMLYKLGSGVTSYEMREGETIQVRALGDGENTISSAWSISVTYGDPVIGGGDGDGNGDGNGDGDGTSLPKLEAPVLTLDGGIARWESIAGAVGYEVSGSLGDHLLDNDSTDYTMSEGESIVVRALGDGVEFANSDWSNNVKLIAPDGDGDGSEGGGNGDGGGDVACVHIDNDDDGSCDSCDVTVIVIVDFYAINDIHGKFCDSAEQPGVDELASYLKSRENADDNVVVLSSGDMWQGTAESNLTYGKLMTEWMNIIGCVSMTLGNHEYDWGEEYIRQNLAVAEFPFLAINIYDTSTGERADYCAPSVMIEEGGIEIGIIGAIGDCYSSILAEMVSGVEFKVGDALTSLVKAEAERLRALGADLIVYSLHDGTSGYDTSLSNGYVDLVFEGHTHSAYSSVDGYGVHHIQGGGENQGISHAEIAVNSVTGSVKVAEAEVIRDSVYSTFEDDPETEALEDKYQQIIDMAYKVLGRASSALSDSQLEDLVARLYYEAGVEIWGNEYNIVLGGGFLKTRSPYDLAAGDVTYADLMSLLPFNNNLVLCSIKGRDLLSRFINSSSSDYHCYLGVSSGTIKDNETYYVVVDTYTSSYAPNRLTEVLRYEEDIYARDLVADYISEGGLEVKHEGYKLTSIEEFIRLCKQLPAGTTSSEKFYVKGTVTSITNTDYGNLYIEDEAGNSLYVYGVYDQSGNRFAYMQNPPKVGDTLVLYGAMQYYRGTTVELMSGVIIECNP